MASLSPFQPPTPVLDRLVKLGSTWNGSESLILRIVSSREMTRRGIADKQFMLLQYGSKLVALSLSKGTLLANSGKLRTFVESLLHFSALVGDYRVFLRLFGLLPILKWYSTSNAAIAAKRKSKLTSLEVIEQLQILSMLAYYPVCLLFRTAYVLQLIGSDHTARTCVVSRLAQDHCWTKTEHAESDLPPLVSLLGSLCRSRAAPALPRIQSARANQQRRLFDRKSS